MFTWNFQYISRARLASTFNQLMLDSAKGDILIRIHTAIHLEDEAVDLARFIKKHVPGAHIFGTSTSAVILNGKLLPNQCVISITQMNGGSVRTAMIPTFDEAGEFMLPADKLCQSVKNRLVYDDTKLLLTFLTGKYLNVYNFIEKCNTYFPGVQMIGGIANTPELSLRKFLDSGFVFDETGYSHKAVILAAIGGRSVDCVSSYATGVDAIGEEKEITDTFGTSILGIAGKDAAESFRQGIGDELHERPELTAIFPYVYSDASDIPILVRYTDNMSIRDYFGETTPIIKRLYESRPDIDIDKTRELIHANHYAAVGKKLKRAIIYDQKIISDNRTLFSKIEKFAKAETIFGYSCIARSIIYANCVRWELSIYENSNICGCITEGEIAHIIDPDTEKSYNTLTGGRNTFANCSFVVSAIGEARADQQFNPYAFSYTDGLSKDNEDLINYFIKVRSSNEQSDEVMAFIKDCETRLLYSEELTLPNAAALSMDIKIKGFDRVCIINVADTAGMSRVFDEKTVTMTYRNYISVCTTYARERHYNIYKLPNWRIAIAAPSYMIALSKFAADMEELQRQLFNSADKNYIAIVPIFCILDNCHADRINSEYNAARIKMMNRNIQFYVRDSYNDYMDTDVIRERYRMVNVINYAITNDKIIPYLQGIHDNKTNKIDHFEALMRLEDENGNIYGPNSFLEVARTYGVLYDTISSIMIHKVLELFKDRKQETVSINIGVRDLRNRELIDYIYDFLSTAKNPGIFVFEILENEDVEDYDRMIEFVNRIHGLGGKIAIDDFGSGFSNLQHVMNIHHDFLKLDGSLVRNCCNDQECANLIALLANWKKLSTRGLSMVAEFVENEEIQEKIKGYGIDYSQGYLFSKPRPAKDVIAELDEG